jgi:hypothetical protein
MAVVVVLVDSAPAQGCLLRLEPITPLPLVAAALVETVLALIFAPQVALIQFLALLLARAAVAAALGRAL